MVQWYLPVSQDSTSSQNRISFKQAPPLKSSNILNNKSEKNSLIEILAQYEKNSLEANFSP